MKLNNISAEGEIDGTLAKIQVDKEMGEIIHYHNMEQVTFLIADDGIDHLVIRLEDDQGESIDFLGVQYHLTFAFKFVKQTLQEYVETLNDKLDELVDQIPDENEDEE